MIPAKADDHSPSREAEYNGWFLTDVLLFTHLVHLPVAYASKTKYFSWLLTLRVGQGVARLRAF